ncbi:YbaB/EbfC family nucleoid-associated protein [Amycolatopsis sp. NPDC005232]|uniref:YbaB/EbfC family nucleoid-associated protein n=1 Tax=Amycolatopsis sp. NPDC005232 TaxID=3157027 RepID=UPI0033B1E8DE
MPSTRDLIGQARVREAALSQVAALMADARGSAHALDGTVEVTVDALGALRRLWLAPSVIDADPLRLAARSRSRSRRWSRPRRTATTKSRSSWAKT